ncbi:glycosyltransferase family 4 protein [Arhodomonas sp. KWT]|nr:glycosyltransferase family 4 protein [Arhodomonas sp. KWT]
MERLIWHILDELRLDYDVYAIGPRGAAAQAPDGVEVTEVPESPLGRFLPDVMWKAARKAASLHPKLVMAGSGLTAPFAWLAARIAGAKAVVYLHGLDIEANHLLYRAFWLPFIRRCDIVLVNSHFTRALAKQAGIDDSRIWILHPGVDLPDLSSAEEARRRFREHHALHERPVMLYVGRITERKGLAPFVEDVLPTVLDAVPDARLVVIGEEPNQALLRGGSVLEKARHSLARHGREDIVCFLGPRTHNDQEISEAYFAANVHVFPIQDRPGDHEGFGMVALEAAAHGTPTVAFAVGGVTDAVLDGVSGRLVPAGDDREFASVLIRHLKLTSAESPEACRSFAADYRWGEFGRKLRAILESRDA